MKQFCLGVFLNVAQAFGSVWHESLLYKFKRFLPSPYCLTIRLYLENRFYVIRYGSSYSSYFCIKAGVPQGDLSPDLFNIYTADIFITTSTTMATYAGDTAILYSSNNPKETCNLLQMHLDSIDNWAIK